MSENPFDRYLWIPHHQRKYLCPEFLGRHHGHAGGYNNNEESARLFRHLRTCKKYKIDTITGIPAPGVEEAGMEKYGTAVYTWCFHYYSRMDSPNRFQKRCDTSHVLILAERNYAEVYSTTQLVFQEYCGDFDVESRCGILIHDEEYEKDLFYTLTPGIWYFDGERFQSETGEIVGSC